MNKRDRSQAPLQLQRAIEKMPPWFADPHVGHFSNDPSLTPQEIATLTSWANAGAPAGDPSDAPPLASWTKAGTFRRRISW